MRVIENVWKSALVTQKRTVQEPIGIITSQSTLTESSDPIQASYIVKSDVIKNPVVGGWRNPSPYNVSDTSETAWTGTFRSWSNGPNYLVQMLQSPHPHPSFISLNRPMWVVPSSVDNLIAKAEVKALNRLKASNINYAVALAESRQTLGLIGNSLLTFAKSAKQAKRGRWKEAAAALGIRKHEFRKGANDFAGRWLELQYGWKPLLSDIYGAYEEWRSYFGDHDPTISVKYTAVDKGDTSTPTAFSGVPGFVRSIWKKLVKVRLDYTVTNPTLQSASRIGWLNPAEIAWELVPYSFVVDWFVPVGAWISSFDAATGLVFRGGSLTTVITTDQVATIEAPYNDWGKPNSSGVGISASATYKSKTFTRTVYPSTPWPLPYFKNPVSTEHAANAYALVVSAMKLH